VHLGPLIAAPAALLGDSSVVRRKLGSEPLQRAALSSVSSLTTRRTTRQSGIKLLQRVALVFLPPRVAAWRYTRGARTTRPFPPSPPPSCARVVNAVSTGLDE